jgi:hypothetical protein
MHGGHQKKSRAVTAGATPTAATPATTTYKATMTRSCNG